jgi:hypothetical protein
MSVTTAILSRSVWGNKLMHFGTYTHSSGGTGGDIVTGMHRCDALFLLPKKSSVASNRSVVNETFPVDGSGTAMAAVTIVTDANQDGYWLAIGT